MLCNNYSDKEVVSLVPLIKLNSMSKFCCRSFTNEQLSQRAQCKIGNNKIKVIGNVKVRKLRHIVYHEQITIFEIHVAHMINRQRIDTMNF